MGSNSIEVNLSDMGLKSISNILSEISVIDDFSKKAEKLEFYVQSMEEEMRKIDAFKRELPHCMFLLNDAIGVLKEKSLQLKEGTGAKGSNEKKSWMSSVNLWSTPVQYDKLLQLGSIMYGEEGSGSNLKKRGGGAFVPYKKPSHHHHSHVMELEEEQMSERVLAVDDRLSLSIPVAEIDSDDVSVIKEGKLQHKKQRRCWSPELHRRFVDALEQLGGAQSATPKQIRDLMKVDGLTNDEVKSHLQKFRLHIRKIPTADLVDYSTFAQNHCKSLLKPMVAHTGSPQGPLPRGNTAHKGGSTSGGDSMEDEEDDKSESGNWNARAKKLVEKPL